MSTTITVGTGSELIHGTYDLAVAYVAMLYGDAADVWTALTPDNRKRTLAAAVRYLNAQSWAEAYEDFSDRDAIAAFATAQYELAVLIADDPSIVSAADQGSNIASLGAGSAQITYFNPTTKGAAPLPPVLMRLLSEYLAASTLTGPDGGESLDSCSDNPFSDCEDYRRGGAY